jgi:hypothetical protein
MIPALKSRWLRFSLRMMFVVLTVFGAALGWAVYQVNWIRQRHAFLERENIVTYPPVQVERPLPWSLRLFGESQQFLIGAPPEELDRARKLFPEAILNLVYPPDLLPAQQHINHSIPTVR